MADSSRAEWRELVLTSIEKLDKKICQLDKKIDQIDIRFTEYKEKVILPLRIKIAVIAIISGSALGILIPVLVKIL